MIAANHDPVDGKLVGKHDWVIRRLNPLRPPSIPSWDLSLVLRALQQGQFEPCKQLNISHKMKTLLLLALTSIKRVGDLHAFSVDDSCLKFGPPDSQIILRPHLCAQGSHFSLRGPSGELASAAPGGGRPSPSFACPVQALTRYVDRTRSLRTLYQLLSVTEAGRKGMLSPSRGWPTG